MYRQAVVTFIDILGFRDIVSNSTAESVKRKLDKVSRFAAPEADHHDEYELDPVAIQFSDSVVRIRPVDGAGNQMAPMGIVFHELLSLVHVQAELIAERVLVRGGVSFGEIFYQGPMVYGPALVSAYDLESKHALYPRIVVAPELLEEVRINRYFRSTSHSPEEELAYIRKLVRQNDDGIWFIDYLGAVLSEMDDPDLYPKFLQDHKQLTLDLASKHSSFGTVAAKYLWLAKYHNNCVRKYYKGIHQTQLREAIELKISQSELPLLQELPTNKLREQFT